MCDINIPLHAVIVYVCVDNVCANVHFSKHALIQTALETHAGRGATFGCHNFPEVNFPP